VWLARKTYYASKSLNNKETGNVAETLQKRCRTTLEGAGIREDIYRRVGDINLQVKGKKQCFYQFYQVVTAFHVLEKIGYLPAVSRPLLGAY